MGVWMMLMLVAVGVPGAAAFWMLGRRVARSAKARLDGDVYEAEEMLVAFGATQEWV